METVFDAQGRLLADKISNARGDLQGEVELRCTELGSPVCRLRGREQGSRARLQEGDEAGSRGKIIPEQQVEPASIDRRRLERQEQWDRLDHARQASLQGGGCLDLGEDITEPWHEGEKVNSGLGRP